MRRPNEIGHCTRASSHHSEGVFIWCPGSCSLFFRNRWGICCATRESAREALTRDLRKAARLFRSDYISPGSDSTRREMRGWFFGAASSRRESRGRRRRSLCAVAGIRPVLIRWTALLERNKRLSRFAACRSNFIFWSLWRLNMCADMSFFLLLVVIMFSILFYRLTFNTFTISEQLKLLKKC